MAAAAYENHCRGTRRRPPSLFGCEPAYESTCESALDIAGTARAQIMARRARATRRPERVSVPAVVCYTAPVHDEQLLSRLFQTYSPLVLRRARRLLGSDADAEEAVQDVFLRAMRHPDVLQDEHDLVGWFYRITTNHCLNRIRDAKRRRELFREHIQPTARDRDDAEPDEMMTMRWLLANADEQQARCAAYVYLDELTYDQVAGLMGVSKRTISNLMDRFKAWARAELEGPELRESVT